MIRTSPDEVAIAQFEKMGIDDREFTSFDCGSRWIHWSGVQILRKELLRDGDGDALALWKRHIHQCVNVLTPIERKERQDLAWAYRQAIVFGNDFFDWLEQQSGEKTDYIANWDSIQLRDCISQEKNVLPIFTDKIPRGVQYIFYQAERVIHQFRDMLLRPYNELSDINIPDYMKEPRVIDDKIAR